MTGPGWQARLARSLPFYYGWVILLVSAVTSYSSRPVMAVATLSIFLVPMTTDLGLSRGLFSSAVSLGGICAVAVSPVVGWWIDRRGAGIMVAAGGALVGFCAIGLAYVTQSWAFLLLYLVGRMSFASPLELGTSTAVSNWFIRRRPAALGLLNGSQGTGLALMPFVAHLIIVAWDWRVAWMSLGLYTLAVAVLPALLLMRRRPEDMGLEPDLYPPREGGPSGGGTHSDDPAPGVEYSFTLAQAVVTRAFWLMAVFSAAGYMVQAGVSLHQASHYLNQGMSGFAAALTVSVFAFSQVPGGLCWSALARRVPLRYLLALSGFTVAAGAVGAAASSTLLQGTAAAAALGAGVGGLHVLLRLAWADYYGRRHLGSIRGVALPVQIGGQALGPIVAGFMFDATDSYRVAFVVFASAVSLAALLVSIAAPPPAPVDRPASSGGG